MAATLFTPVTLWQGFDVSQPLNTSVIREYEQDNILFKEIYFSGRVIGQNRPRIFGIFAVSKNAVNPPALLLANDVSKPVDISLITYFCQRGVAVLAFDYTGEKENKQRFTVFPEEISYANYGKSGRHYDYCDISAKENCWYEWTAVARYALSQIEVFLPKSKIGVLGIRRGGLISWQLSAIDDRVSAGISLFFAGWERYRSGKYIKDYSVEMNEETQRYLAGIAVESYASYVRVPFLYLTSTNDDCTYLDRACDTLIRVQSHVPLIYGFSPRFYKMLGDTSSSNIDTFLKKYLLGEEILKPSTPKLTIENRENNSVFRLVCDTSAEIKEARIFFSLDGYNPVERDWIKAKTLKVGEGIYEAVVPSGCFEREMIAYPHVSYMNNFSLSGNLINLPKSQIAASSCKLAGKILYQSAMGEDSFLCYPVLPLEKATDMFMHESSVCLCEGPLGIKGIATRYGALASFKFSSALFRGNSESLLKFDVYSEKPQKLTVYAFENKGTDIEKKYHAEIPLLGGEIWQPAVCKCSDFKTDDNIPLKSFEKLSMMAFYTTEKALYNNMLWV